ncbi:pyridoxal phosphate phosphatase PHOSPHO2-like [Eurytemora carolleeae]|uniref:pyridoxal phosphate phosphatase PHOSPHO2-like n=1 Tax=Eurytemora carolleeae TaxID=1294199 RepID=UPI000C7776D3|nr:pyridoxal phosphate phosphatase PHOSPHO2-like [Eurytemora carolleeae]|eukprot:XP_023335045.1 pyridoxal phosphate phosphatase PHOSPHO2-like [Eurytemora affinis]
MIGPLLVFDFDQTIADLNTDVEVQKLHPEGKIPETSEIHKLYDKTGWTDYMGAVFKLLHSHNISKDQILELMGSLQFTPGMVELLKTSVEEHNAKIIIISDSNSVFIEHILEYNGLKHLVDAVFTNPAEWGEEGLTIKPYHHQVECELSTQNLCKEKIRNIF